MLKAKHGKTNARSGAGKLLNLQSIIRRPKSFHRPQSVTRMTKLLLLLHDIHVPQSQHRKRPGQHQQKFPGFFHLWVYCINILEMIEVGYWTGMLCNGFFNEILALDAFSMLPRPDEWETRTRPNGYVLINPIPHKQSNHTHTQIPSRFRKLTIAHYTSTLNLP